jgi:nitrate reductase delta subunit
MRRGPRRLTPAQLSLAWQSASLLLDYPDRALVDRLGLVRQASYALPPPVGGPLRTVVASLEETPLATLEADYVETFDSRRRHTLFLTYFAHGDTRKRGAALRRFKQT